MSRGFARTPAALLLSVFLLVGCVATQDTLAQQLAWERIEKCKGIGASLQVTRVEPDGRIWYQTQGGNQGATEFNNCLRAAAVEQGKRKATPAAPPAAAATSGMTTASTGSAGAGIALPRWNVGDEWAYRQESPGGAGTFVWAVDGVDTIDGVEHYVVKAETRRIYYRVSDGAITLQKVSTNVANRYTPAWVPIAWPLTAGASWESRFTEEWPQDRRTEEIARACTAGPEEMITVPAGTFATIPIVCRNASTGTKVYEWWYSPLVKHIVREVVPVSGGERVRELIAYKLR